MQEEQLDHQEEELHVVGCKLDDEMQIMMMKGNRTKRQRLSSPPSPLRLSISLSSSDYSGTASSIDHEEEEKEDMANCLILLAQGHKSTPVAAAAAAPLRMYRSPASINNNKKGSGSGSGSGSGLKLYIYECKTCNKCFPSYQALGGHRVSHKKLPMPNHTQENKAVTTFGHDYYDPTNTTLTLQLSSNSSKRSRTTMTSSSSAKSKVHECSMCGTQFSSGQALGGHMRRHRDHNNNSTNNRANALRPSLSMSNGSPDQTQQSNTPRNVLKLDLNLPAPEDDTRDSNFPFETKEKVIVFSATSLVDCHY